jgi:hypothetical protein
MHMNCQRRNWVRFSSDMVGRSWYVPGNHGQEEREHGHAGLERCGVRSVGVLEADEEEERVHEQPAEELA